MSPASESHGPFPCHLSQRPVCHRQLGGDRLLFRSSLLPSGSRSSDKFVNEYRVVQIHTYIHTYNFLQLHRCELSRISRCEEIETSGWREEKERGGHRFLEEGWFPRHHRFLCLQCTVFTSLVGPQTLVAALTTCQYASSECFPMGDTWWPCTAS